MRRESGLVKSKGHMPFVNPRCPKEKNCSQTWSFAFLTGCSRVSQKLLRTDSLRNHCISPTVDHSIKSARTRAGHKGRLFSFTKDRWP
jgi:hypothetical protein